MLANCALANDIDIRQYEFANTLENGWWEEKHKRHTDLITLICKLSGKRCNQIIRILPDNWEKDILFVIMVIQFISNKSKSFSTVITNKWISISFSKHRIRMLRMHFILCIFLNILWRYLYTYFLYILRETHKYCRKFYAIFSHRPQLHSRAYLQR